MFNKRLSLYKTSNQIDAWFYEIDPRECYITLYVYNLQILIINKMFDPYKAFQSCLMIVGKA